MNTIWRKKNSGKLETNNLTELIKVKCNLEILNIDQIVNTCQHNITGGLEGITK